MVPPTVGTNQGGYEIYTVLGEAFGSGLPLGYLFVKNIGKPAVHSKQKVLEQFLTHFRDKYQLKVNFTHTDKDASEIGACRCIYPDAKEQLCFWHSLDAVKTRLRILRRQPAHYDVKAATDAFNFIEPTFLPVKQQPVSQPVCCLFRLDCFIVYPHPLLGLCRSGPPCASHTGETPPQRRVSGRLPCRRCRH